MTLNENILMHLRSEDNINESLESIIAKAKQGILTTAMLSSIMSSDAFSNNEKNMIMKTVETNANDETHSTTNANILSKDATNTLYAIRDCLNLNQPLSKIDYKAFTNAIYNINNMTDKITNELNDNLSPEQIKRLQSELINMRGPKFHKTNAPEQSVRPTGVIDKQTLITVVNFLREYKNKSITANKNKTTTFDPNMVKSKFPSI